MRKINVLHTCLRENQVKREVMYFIMKMDTGGDEIKGILGPIRILLQLCMSDPTQSKLWGRVLYAILIVGSCFFYYGAMLHAQLHFNDILKFSATLTVLTAHSTASAKLTALIFKKDKLKSLFETINEKFWSIKNVDDPIEKQTLFGYIRLFKILVYGDISSIICTVTCFFTIPIIVDSREFHIPLHYTFVDTRESPYYQILFVLEVFIVTYNAPIGHGAFDSLFFSIMTILLLQFRILKYKIRSIGTNKNDSDDVKRQEDLKLMKKCVEHHKLLLKFSNDVRSLFAEMLLLQYVDTCITTCFAFIVVGNLKNFNLMSFGVYLTSHLIQLYLFCAFGSLFIDESTNLAEAAYNSEWQSYYNKDLSCGMQLMMMQARNTPKFTAGYIIDLDLGNFVNVIRLSFSVRTLFASRNE